MRISILATLCAALVLVGCASVHTSTVDALVAMQTHSSFDPLFYVGSDDRYHYFNRLNLKYWQKYRVSRSALSMPATFSRKSGKSEVMWPGTLEKAKAASSPPNKSLERTRAR
jgi:hypothetical protein